MKDFAAIDFETANNERSSVCSVGIVIVRDGEIVDKFYYSSSPNRSITTIGVVRCMACALPIQKMRPSSLKCGNR